MPACWIEVNLDAIAHNYQAVARMVGAGTTIIAVIKANAYGHGTVEVGRELAAQGASHLAVTRLDEAVELREAGIEAPILLLTPALPDEVDDVVRLNLTACVTCFEDGNNLGNAAVHQNRTVLAHIKVNAGMGRLGVEPEAVVALAKRFAGVPGLKIDGAFTHFSHAAEKDTATTHDQYGKFMPLIHHIGRALDVPPQNFHCANSATMLRFPGMRLSRVRPGTVLYGQYPSTMAAEAGQQIGLTLRDTFEVKARIVAIRDLKPGQGVGYGSEWRARGKARIATLAVGYADGLSQTPNTHYEQPLKTMQGSLRQVGKSFAEMGGLKKPPAPRTAEWKGQRVAIVGRIAMQQCSIDITHLQGVEVGDEAKVVMRRTSAGAHLPRIYVRDNAP